MANDISHVVIDTDLGHDDYGALIYLLKHPKVKVEAIIVTGCGVCNLSRGYDNIHDVLSFVGKSDIPVLKGWNKPMMYSNMFPPDFRRDANNLFKVRIPKSNAPQQKGNVAEFCDFLARSGNKIDLLSIGGLTTLGYLLKADHDLSFIRKVFIMGGAVNVIGNVGYDLSNSHYLGNYAEWNIFVDPVATEYVLESDLQLLFVPLDACYQVASTRELISELDQIQAAGWFIKQIENSRLDTVLSAGGCEYMYDQLAASVLVGTPGLVQDVCNDELRVEVEFDEEANHLGELSKTGRCSSRIS